MNKVHLNVRVPGSMRSDLNALAEREGTSASDIVRDQLHAAIKQRKAAWDRIDQRVSRLPSQDLEDLDRMQNTLLDRIYDLSAQEEYLLDQIQDEIRGRYEDEDAREKATLPTAA